MRERFDSEYLVGPPDLLFLGLRHPDLSVWANSLAGPPDLHGKILNHFKNPRPSGGEGAPSGAGDGSQIPLYGGVARSDGVVGLSEKSSPSVKGILLLRFAAEYPFRLHVASLVKNPRNKEPFIDHRIKHHERRLWKRPNFNASAIKLLPPSTHQRIVA